MSLVSCIMVATFTSPESIGVNPLAMLWMLPLTAAVAIVYKATKLPIITTRNFIKETLSKWVNNEYYSDRLDKFLKNEGIIATKRENNLDNLLEEKD